MKRALFAGLLIWIPLAVTVWVIVTLVNLMDSTLGLLPEAWQPEALLGFSIPGLGVVLTALVLGLTGLMATNLFGRWLLDWWNRVLQRIPFFNTIYSSVKQVSDTLLSSNGEAFRKAVLVPYPHPGVWSIGFVTGEVPDAASEHMKEASLAVYVPTALSPTSGFVVWVAQSEVRPSGMTVDEALKYVVSMGVVAPAAAVDESKLNQ